MSKEQDYRTPTKDLPPDTESKYKGGGFVDIKTDDRMAPYPDDTTPALPDMATFNAGVESARLAKSEIVRNTAPGQEGYLSAKEFTTGRDFRNLRHDQDNVATIKK